MSAKFCTVRPHPCLLTIDQDLLLLVYNVVMDDAGHAKLVSFGTISVKYHLPNLQVLHGNGTPL